MSCVACREVVAGALYYGTRDCLRWASSHCARTSATADLRTRPGLTQTGTTALEVGQVYPICSPTFPDHPQCFSPHRDEIVSSLGYVCTRGRNFKVCVQSFEQNNAVFGRPSISNGPMDGYRVHSALVEKGLLMHDR